MSGNRALGIITSKHSFLLFILLYRLLSLYANTALFELELLSEKIQTSLIGNDTSQSIHSNAIGIRLDDQRNSTSSNALMSENKNTVPHLSQSIQNIGHSSLAVNTTLSPNNTNHPTVLTSVSQSSAITNDAIAAQQQAHLPNSSTWQSTLLEKRKNESGRREVLNKTSNSAAIPTTNYRNVAALHDGLMKIPSNLSVVFVGDSVMRFQYISLIHYLHTGRWIDDSDMPNLVVKSTFKSWREFFEFAATAFHGKEACDCFRNNGTVYVNKVSYENRHYQENGYSISFVRKNGKLLAHGHWPPEAAFHPQPPEHSVTYDEIGKQPPLWTETTWGDLIRNYIAKIIPKPKYIVMNAGIWKHNLNKRSFAEIRSALDEEGMIGIYKTTTKMIDEGTDMQPHDVLGCQVLDYCLDMSWTGNLTSFKDYSDRLHFTAGPNRHSNEQFLQLVIDIES